MIKITEQNIKYIYGMLKKFFMSDTHGYITWHNFDCGNGKIKPYLNMTPSYYSKPINFAMDKNISDGKLLIRINPRRGEGVIFQIGDEIELKSGLIKHKQKWYITDYKNIYRVFQACKPTLEQIEEQRDRAIYNRILYGE